MRKKHFFLVMLAIFVCVEGSAFAQKTQQFLVDSETKAVRLGSAYGEHLGTVRLPFTCNEAAMPYAIRGLALLHHMTYEGAREQFAKVVELDPASPAGYWGLAMTLIHPLWSDPSSKKEFEEGKALVAKARERVGSSAKANAFVEAVGAYFDQGHSSNEKANLRAFEQKWLSVHKLFPNDAEATSFYSLAHLATASPSDKNYVKQKKAIELLKPVLQEIPDHPGAHHYTIHASDYPPLAASALDVARNYGKIAPTVPHALHMPTHIFTRLGLWPDSIIMNTRSANAAALHQFGENVSLHYLHALDYLAYAYLQRGEDDKAQKIYETIVTLSEQLQPHVASAYTIAAVPARVALERQQWDDAAALEIRTPEDFPWDNFPAMEALTYYARALGSAKIGNGTEARLALERMQQLQEQAARTSSYWAKQVEIQRMSAEAWLEYEEGRTREGLKAMAKAAKLEATTEKHPVTPGEVLPARELYADMLLADGQYREAEKQYLAVLKRSPNRFNSLYGAGRAAELGKDKQGAFKHYKQLIEMVDNNSDRKRLQQAKTFLEEQK